MPQQSLTADTWTELKASASLSDDTVYTIQNIGSTRIKIETETGSGGTPSSFNAYINPHFNDPASSTAYASAASGTGIWVLSENSAGLVGIEETS